MGQRYILLCSILLLAADAWPRAVRADRSRILGAEFLHDAVVEFDGADHSDSVRRHSSISRAVEGAVGVLPRNHVSYLPL